MQWERSPLWLNLHRWQPFTFCNLALSCLSLTWIPRTQGLKAARWVAQVKFKVSLLTSSLTSFQNSASSFLPIPVKSPLRLLFCQVINPMYTDQASEVSNFLFLHRLSVLSETDQICFVFVHNHHCRRENTSIAKDWDHLHRVHPSLSRCC